jgi:hypothetical protein
VVDGTYVGIARIFKRGCGQFPYRVSGPILEGGRRIRLVGAAPIVDGQCRVVTTKVDQLDFELIEKSPVHSESAKPIEISEWNSEISSKDPEFYAFVEKSAKGIVKISGAASDDAVSSQETGICTVGHTNADGMGTNYRIECSRQAGEWKIQGFFTQREWNFHRGHMEITFDRVPDGIVLLQRPIVRLHKP